MTKRTAQTPHMPVLVVACAAIMSACAGGDTGSATVTTLQSAAPTTATTSPPPTEPNPVPTTAVLVAPDTTTSPTTTVAVPTGPPSTDLMVPGDDGYFDAIGADVIRFDGSVLGTSVVEIVDREGNGWQELTSDDGVRTAWLQDGELFREVDGLLEPVLFASGSFTLMRDARIGFPGDVALMGLLMPGDEIQLETGPGRRFAADPAAVLDYQRADHPEWWEWEAADLEIDANHGGALVAYRETARYTLFPAPGMIDPPPPLDVVDEVTVAINAADRLEPFPADRLHPEAGDLLAQALVDRAVGAHSFQIERAFFRGDATDPSEAPLVTVDDLNSTVADFFPERFAMIFGTLEDAGGSVIGFEDGTMVVESESGTWFCQVGRASINDTNDALATGSGSTARGAWESCREQHT